MDWTAEKAREAQNTLVRWRQLTETSGIGTVDSEVLEALANDLNTAGMLARLYRLEKDGNLPDLVASANLVGLLTPKLDDWNWRGALSGRGSISMSGAGTLTLQSDAMIERLQVLLGSRRVAAMASKDFSAVDALKSALIAAGVEVRMSKAGVELVPGPDFDPAKLETLK
jgi:cysteinyl-tRNA synthetase